MVVTGVAWAAGRSSPPEPPAPGGLGGRGAPGSSPAMGAAAGEVGGVPPTEVMSESPETGVLDSARASGGLLGALEGTPAGVWVPAEGVASGDDEEADASAWA